MPRSEQHIRFCKSRDGARIAVATLGRGPPLLRTAHWLSHVEHDARSPVWTHWLGIDVATQRATGNEIARPAKGRQRKSQSR
jgi:hypothetical protein